MKKFGFIFTVSLLALSCFLAFSGCLSSAEKPHKHVYTDKVVAPTCTEGGYTLHECECGESYRSDITEKNGHDFGETTYAWSEYYTTCKATRVCNVCGEVDSEVANSENTVVGNVSCHPIYDFTAEFANPNFALQEANGIILHDFCLEQATADYLYHKVDCYAPQTYYKSCRCGAHGTETFTVGEKLKHLVVDGVCTICGSHDVLCSHYHVDEILQCGYEGFCSPARCSCDICGTEFYKDLTCDDIGMPIIFLDDSVFDATIVPVSNVKNVVEGVNIRFTSNDLTFEDVCSVQLEGITDAFYAKKNYTIAFDSKIKIADDWNSQSTYCLTANYMDRSMGRNIIAGALYGQIVQSRGINDTVNTLPNGGAEDGFPVLVYVNNAYHGLYTFNIAKDNTLVGMQKSGQKDQAMLFAHTENDSALLKENIVWDNGNDDWDIVFYSNEDSMVDDDETWVIDGMNRLITFINTSSDTQFKNNIRSYIDFERTLDTLIFTCIIGAEDNLGNNILWLTYDGGNTWFPSPCDTIAAFGMSKNGTFENIDYNFDCFGSKKVNKLWQRMYSCFRSEFTARYTELRNTVVTYDNISSAMQSYKAVIYAPLFEVEKVKWKSAPSVLVDQYSQMKTWINARLTYLDGLWYNK